MGVEYIFDSHVHSEHSFDAKEPVAHVCEYAIAKGIEGLCLTDHAEMNEYDEALEQSIKNAYEEIVKAKRYYEGKLKLGVGIELGQPHHNLQVANRIVDTYNYDFILGSMHAVRNEKDFYYMSKEDFVGRLDDLLTRYYEEIYEMVSWGKIDVIGHITYPLRYVQGVHKVVVDLTKYNSMIYDILKLAVAKGIGIEINVSGFRQQYGKQFPNFEHIKMYTDLGGDIITLGSDSHTKDTLGQDFDKGKALILEAGLKYYCAFEGRVARHIKIERNI